MKTLSKVILGLAIVGTVTSLSANGADLYKKCAGCHGVNAEKKALRKSHIIKDWDAKKIASALHGYKDGTYGGPMKALMKGQVAALSDEQIESLAKYIESK
jgi:cytochrome c553